MARRMPWSGAGLWTVPAAMLVVFALLLAVPEDSAPATGTESISVPYVETVVSPEVSRVYSLTSSVEAESVEIQHQSLNLDASRNASAVTADQDELSVTSFPIDAYRTNAVAWHNSDVFYASLYNPRYITMIDASENSTSTWLTPLSGTGTASGLVDSSGSYYALIYKDGNAGIIFRLDPTTDSFTTWNEKKLIQTSEDTRLFVDSSDNLYFASSSGSYDSNNLFGDVITTTTPFVTLSSRTESDSLGVEYISVDVSVRNTGNFYGTLKMPDGNTHTFSHSDGGWNTHASTAGVLGAYTATVQNRLGTTTATITLTEEQKVTHASSPLPPTQDQFVVLANKFDPNTNTVTAFYREPDPSLLMIIADAEESSNLPHMTLADVDGSGTMYFDVFHGTREYTAFGVAKFDQNFGTITIWPNTSCPDLDVTGDKIYCLHAGQITEVDTSSNTVRQWTDPGHSSGSSSWSIDVDSTGTVFFVRDGNLVRFVPSTGTFTTFDIDNIRRVQVDSSDTLHAVQSGSFPIYYALTLQ